MDNHSEMATATAVEVAHEGVVAPPHEQGIEQTAEALNQELSQDAQDVQEEQGQDLSTVVVPNSLHLSGVDDLSTEQIKEYIDLHIRPGYSFTNRSKYAYLEYRINWINDHEVNIVFDHNENTERRRGRISEIERRRNQRNTRRGDTGDRGADLMDIINGVDSNGQGESDEPSIPPHLQEKETEAAMHGCGNGRICQRNVCWNKQRRNQRCL